MLYVPPPPATVAGQTGEDNNPARAHSTRLIKVALVVVILCGSILSRFGVNLGSYSLDFSLIAQYMLLGAILMSGALRLDGRCVLLFACCVIFSCLSYLLNREYASISSLFLLLVIYFPYIYTLSPAIDAKALWRWTMNAFGVIASICAIAGIAQFCAQPFIHAPWLFDFSTYIPPQILGQHEFNTVIPIGHFYKSNGFFMAEPSGFSQFMAIAMICEWVLGRRWHRLALYGIALILSYSGTGLLTLFIASLFPLGRKTAVRLLLLTAATILIVSLFGESLNLDFTLNRATEFGSETSSGYARFIAPMRLLIELFASDPWSPFVGHGPGMIFRTVRNYAFHDPTWAKLLFEYGAFGTAAFLGLVLYTIRRRGAHAEIVAVLFFSWLLMGGHLLSPAKTTLMFVLLAMWPRPEGINVPAKIRT